MEGVYIEELAEKILQWLQEKGLWTDCRIYFNGMAYSTDDRDGNSAGSYQQPVYIIENIDPKDYFEYVGDILSMSFEGLLYEVLNGYLGSYGSGLCREFSSILSEYGLYYELGNAWNLSVYQNG